jgi:hypothetical protein
MPHSQLQLPPGISTPDTRQPAAALLRLRLGFQQHSSRMLGSLLSNQHSSGLSGHKPWALTARTACSAVTLVAPGTGVASHSLRLVHDVSFFHLQMPRNGWNAAHAWGASLGLGQQWCAGTRILDACHCSLMQYHAHIYAKHAHQS